MKKILVVDDRADFPSAGEHTERVDFREHLAADQRPDVSEYATAFVHVRNDVARSWAEDTLDLFFKFSGEEDHVTETAGVYTLPRGSYRKYFADFMDAYVATGGAVTETVAGVFRGRAAENAEAGTAPSARRTPLPIYFTTEQDASKEGVFPIEVEKDKKEIDYRATLAPLHDFTEPRPVHVEETYLNELDGLNLLLRLRVASDFVDGFYECSRFPVHVQLGADWEARTQGDAEKMKYAALLSSPGVQTSGAFPPVSEAKGELVSEDEHREVLEALPVRPKGQKGRHDLSNEWGPLQLWNGLKKLSTGDFAGSDWAFERYDRLTAREYYAYLLALSHYRNSGDAEPHDEDGDPYDAWKAFLEAHRGNPLEVLVVDDELNEGWDEALRALFSSVPESDECVRLNTQLCEYDFEDQFHAVKNIALSQSWDLVLCDLRLREEDSEQSARSVHWLSGAKLIAALKEKHKNVPVVAFTASNKAWSVQKLVEEGLDGYWIKENPEHGVDAAYSVQNAVALMEAVINAVEVREKAAPTWELRQDVGALTERQEYLAGWENGIEANKRFEVKQRLLSIVERLERAYWFLTSRSTRHDETFGVRATDVAFLTVWSCINEVFALYFDLPKKGEDGPYRLDRWSHAEFRMRNPADREWFAYWIVEDGKEKHISDLIDVLDEGKKHWQKAKRKFCPIRKGRADWPRSSRDTIGISLLLLLLGENAKERRFNDEDEDEGLRDLRNSLEAIHGKVKDREGATQKDIDDLVAIWRTLLVEPFE